MPGPNESEMGESELVVAPLAGRALAEVVWDCWQRGEAVLPCNPALTRAEADRLVDRLRPTAIVDGDGRRRLAGGEPVAANVAAVVATSGTTGEPKGVELTRAGMDVMGRGYTEALDATGDDRWLACLPLHHVASLGVLARSYVTGIPYTVHDGFDLERVANAPRAEGVTMVSLVPTTVKRLLDAGAPLHEYRRIIVGGAPCPPALRARAEAAGATIADAYGLSETWGGFAIDGLPIAGAEAKLGDGNEILVRGAMVMRAYRRDPIRTAETLQPDGWLHTGDVGSIDDEGRIRVHDRLKDLVITGGVNVGPTEIEATLMQHPALADVCVIGVPDDDWGERVVACVVVDDAAAAPTLDELREFARATLSVAKLPRELRVVDAIPRSPGGKPLRRVLRDA